MKLVSFAKETLTDAARIITTKEGLKRLYGVPLYRNAVYLMLNSGAVNVTGFFFWLLAARLYSTEAVGLASAAISAIALLTLISTLGLDYALIRFLPGSGDKARSMINSSFTLTGAISIALAFIFLAGLKVWSPALLFIREHPVFFTVFIITTAATTLRLFADRTLIARRRAGFSLGQGLIFGLLRFAPLVILAGSFQTFGIFTSWGIAISLAAVGLIIILMPYIVLNLKGNFKHSLGITLAVVIPFLAALVAMPSVWALVVREIPRILVQQSVAPFIQIPVVLETYGYLPVLLSLVGTLLLALRGGIKNYALALGLLFLLSMLAIFYTFGYGIEMMYYRGLQYAMLMLSIVAGAGLMAVKNLKLPNNLMTRLKAPPVIRNVGYALCLILIGLTLSIAIPARQNTPYYHMIDEEDYQAFVWIRDNVDNSYRKAVLDPWKGTAFTGISGRNVYTWIGDRPRPSDEKAYEFLGNGSEDTAFLKDNGISIVYTQESVNSTDLVRVKEYVYLLKEAQAP